MLAKMYGSNPRSNSSIQVIGGLGRGRNREGGGRNESSVGKRNLASGFECMLGATTHGAEVGAKICGAELGVKICGAELGAMCFGAEVPAT